MVCIYFKTFLQYGIVQQYEIPEEPMMVAECTYKITELHNLTKKKVR